MSSREVTDGSSPPEGSETGSGDTDLNVKGMLESGGNARNKAEVGWRGLIDVYGHHGEKNGCHVVTVDSDGTTKE